MLSVYEVHNKEHKIIVANESRASVEGTFYKNFYIIVQEETIMYQIETGTTYGKQAGASSITCCATSVKCKDVREAVNIYNSLPSDSK